jgi:hypothetical protein
MDFLMLMLEEITTQEPHQWTQMLKFGKEKKSMMVKFMVKKNTCKMLLISKLMVTIKRLLPTLDYHMLQPPRNQARLLLSQHQLTRTNQLQLPKVNQLQSNQKH